VLSDPNVNPLGVIDPSQLAGLKLWCRYNSGITVTGSGVSQWDDVSGNGNHQKQGTDLDRPQKQGDGSILYDGIRQFTKADAFTFEQPEYIFILGRQVTWTSNDKIFDGNVLNSGLIYQRAATPELALYAGGSAVGNNTDLAVNTYGVFYAAINGASSFTQVDSNSPTSLGNAGSNDMNGLTLGANGSNLEWSNIQLKEVVAGTGVLDAATAAQVIAYLSGVGGL